MEMKIQKELFNSLLNRLIHAPVNLFHDTTPISRILSYFSADLNEINADYFDWAAQFLYKGGAIISIFVSTVYHVPFFIVPLLVSTFGRVHI